MKSEKELTQDEIKRLKELRAEYWELDAQAVFRMNFVIERQEAINLEVLDIVLGIRE